MCVLIMTVINLFFLKKKVMLQAKDEIIIFAVNEYNFKLKFCSCIPFRLLEAILLMILIS